MAYKIKNDKKNREVIPDDFYEWVKRENAKKGLETISRKEMGEMVSKMKGKIDVELRN